MTEVSAGEPATSLELTDAYFLELGRFIHEFAEIETMAKLMCANLSGTILPVIQVLFADITMRNAIETIRKLRDATAKPKSDLLHRGLVQLEAIVAMRNLIVHRGAEVGVADGRTRAGLSPPERARSRPADPGTLQAMSADLRTIKAIFALTELRSAGLEQVMEAFEQAASAPWQYTP